MSPSAAPLELIDATPRERRDDEGREIWWARKRPAKDQKLEHAPLCENAAHRIVVYGRVVTLKGERKVRDAVWVCAECKPEPIVVGKGSPARREYPKHPEVPAVYPMTREQLTRTLNVRSGPWWPGPEPKLPADADDAAKAAHITAHKEWERHSRDLWSARLSLATYHIRLAEQGSDSGGYEA